MIITRLAAALYNLPFNGKWVKLNLFNKIRDYLELMRFHQPAGIFFLLLPCLWSLTMASKGMPDLYLIILFTIGAVVMRAAGCIINDIMDRDIDIQVKRTKSRPIAAGKITVNHASILCCVLLVIALIVLLNFNATSQILGACSIIPVIIYPMMKRITNWPQLFLGLTINWGVLLGWTVVTDSISLAAIFMYLGAVTWTLGYDTIYAHQDREDDMLIGAKSTAVHLGKYAPLAIKSFYTMSCIFWVFAANLAIIPNLVIYGVLAIVYGLFLYQWRMTDFNNPEQCMNMFKANVWIGILIWVGLLYSY